MGGRPSISANLILLDGNKDHRSAADIKARRDAESALSTGVHIEMWPEVKANKKAAEEFERVRELLKYIAKDDALQEGVVNRYCLLRAECVDFEKKRETFMRSLAELKREYKAEKLDTAAYFGLVTDMQKNIVSLDKQIMSKRNMMLAIEKENLMTIASALRSIPKKAPTKKTQTPLEAAGFGDI